MPAPISPRLIVDDVYDRLLASIVDGESAAGAVLGIDALARELGVSTSPVREALVRLEATGLVERTALRGYRVAAELDAAQLDDLMQARLMVEPFAAALAAERAEPGLVSALDTEMTALAAAPRGSSFEDFRAYFEADVRFHRAIVAQAGNRFVRQAYEALGGHVQRFRMFAGHGVTDAEQTIAEHRAIRDALAAGDAEAARAAMAAHLSGVRHRVGRESAD